MYIYIHIYAKQKPTKDIQHIFSHTGMHPCAREAGNMTDIPGTKEQGGEFQCVF